MPTQTNQALSFPRCKVGLECIPEAGLRERLVQRLGLYQDLRMGIASGRINQQDILYMGKAAAYHNELAALKTTDDMGRSGSSTNGVLYEMGMASQGVVGLTNDLANDRSMHTYPGKGGFQGPRFAREDSPDLGMDVALTLFGGYSLVKLFGRLGWEAVAGAGLRAGEGLAGLSGEEAGAAARALCKFNSFTPDTPVQTILGLAPIGTLAVGQKVLAYNETTGKDEYQPIQHVFINQDPQITFLTLMDGQRDEAITTTPEHPFYVKEWSDGEKRPKPVGHEDLNEHWVGAGHLRVGDKIQKADGTTGTVKFVNTIQETRTMYNLEVAEAHTFFVGTQGWLVHNGGLTVCPNLLRQESLGGHTLGNLYVGQSINEMAIRAARG